MSQDAKKSTRQNIKRVASESVQGEGSWVSVKALTLGESKQIAAEATAGEGDTVAQLALATRLIQQRVLAWTWVDDEGNDLPLPSADPNVVDLLTTDEVLFLGRAINGSIDPK